MFAAVTLALALLAQQTATAVDCNGTDSARCTSLFDAAVECTDNVNNPTNNCGTVCTAHKFNFLVDCQQCSLNLEYEKKTQSPSDVEGHSPITGNSYYYAVAASNVRGLYYICRRTVGVPAGARNITEPPRPAQLPPNFYGRPRTCTWLCDRVNDYGPGGGGNDTTAIKDCLIRPTFRKRDPCNKVNQDVCNQPAFDNRATCYQCLFSSASSTGYANDTSAQAKSRRDLDEMVQGCGVLGHQLVNRPLYTQWPIPNNPALAYTVAPTTTYLGGPTSVPSSKPNGASVVAPEWVALAAAVVVHVL